MSGYKDLTSDRFTPDLAQIQCYTVNSTPTTVVWKKDGDVIDLHTDKYTTMQFVTDRRNSHYLNILFIKDVFDIMGNATFTCKVENIAGSTQHNIGVDIAGK